MKPHLLTETTFPRHGPRKAANQSNPAMAGKGNPKGSNGGGGMRKGAVTKKVAARRKLGRQQAAAAEVEIVQAAEAEAAATGLPRNKLAKEILEDACNYYYGLAAKYQPAPGNATADEKLFDVYMTKAANIAKDLAPYQSPRLANTVLRGDKDAPIHHTVAFQFVDGSGQAVSPADAVASSLRPAATGASPV